MNIRTQQVVIFVLGMLAGILLIAQFAFRENKEEKGYTTRLVNQYQPPKLPKQMTLFGEKVPMERAEIREQFDRELIYNSYSQGHMLYLLKLSKRYFPIIEERLKANGVPDDFKYLCVAESNLQNLTSRVGAVGYWQFMPTTAPGYGMEVGDNVDDRYNIIKSTDAACDYLKQGYKKFGNWTAAAASYNCGMGGYNAQATFQKTNNYYDLLLPDETNKYIFRILSFKHIMSNPEQSGLIVNEEDLYTDIPTKTVTVNNSISNLADWAIANGTNYKMIKRLNPWLRGRSLSVKPGKSYVVKLPA
jgi:membrane-bound lytic murein transglycosylase D